MRAHTLFKREPINAGLTFMVIYSCFCACFCTPDFRMDERAGGGGSGRQKKKEREGEEECAPRGCGGCLDARGAARWLGPL